MSMSVWVGSRGILRLAALVLGSLLLGSLVGMISTGCGKSAEATEHASVGASAGRRAGAEGDDGVVRLAQIAAVRGDGALTAEAVRSIRDSATRDDTATASALILAGIGERREAALIARMIQNDAMRGSTLARLARISTK
jgi:hypothetical protein